MPVIPSTNLDPNAAPWGRWVTDNIQELLRNAQRSTRSGDNLNKQQNSGARVLQQQVADIAAVVDTLTAISKVEYSEFITGISNFSGFYNGERPAITMTSPTGRIEVNFGGSLNGGDGYFCYSVTNNANGNVTVTRDSVQANPAQRVALSGGAAFAPSGYKSMVLTVPQNVPITVRLELFATSTYTYFFGGSILVRTAP